jgi:pimeloyl-ACP methyl ester carboxylesterase
MHVFYLHGFASSPQSSKATFFSDRLAELGVRMHCPDFNRPEFSTLTISRMLQQLEKRIAALPPGDVCLIGSSLGGFVAVEAAARQVSKARHPIKRVVLLAPAVELEWDKWNEIGRFGITAWRRTGEIEVFHYAYNELRRLKYRFYEDAARYRASEKRLDQPLLIFQGRLDESVSPAVVEEFAGRQPTATLHMLDDTHQLKNSFDFIWRETSKVFFPSSA